MVSIPLSGFLVVKPQEAVLTDILRELFQSLCRDSWWSNWQAVDLHPPLSRSFNPFVGILGGQTKRGDGMVDGLLTRFNPFVGILGGQTRYPRGYRNGPVLVSIPLSGFLVVKLDRAVQDAGGYQKVSIPLSGFLVVKLNVGCIGHLVVARFQSLCRDSWWSN